LIDIIENKGDKAAAKAKKDLTESMASIAEIFVAQPYFLSDDFTMVDASVAPILWRLRHYGIEMPAEAKAINTYADRLFEREGFVLSLTESERELRL
jgi:RNA polymerase-associated protein